MRKAFSMLMALMLVSGFIVQSGAPVQAIQASSDGIDIISNAGEPMSQVSVDSIADPFEGYRPDGGPQRGFRFVMLTVTITNVSTHPQQPNYSGFYVVDQDGFLYQSTYVYRDDALVPDLRGDVIPPGESVTGAVFFQLLNSAVISTIVFEPDYERLYVLASDVDAPETGAPVSILGDEGGVLGTVAASDFTDPYDEVDPDNPAPRGYHYAAVTITIENTSSRPISIDPSSFLMVDEDGFMATSTGAYRGDSPEVPNLTYEDLAPGDTTTGVVVYKVFLNAAPAMILYRSGGTQLVPLAMFDGAPTISSIASIPVAVVPTPGPTPSPTATAEPTVAAEETGDCVGVNDWFTRLFTRSSALDVYDISIDSAEDLESTDADTLSEFTDALEALIKEQKADTPPAAAQDLSDQFNDFLNLQLDLMNEILDAKDAGSDLQPLIDDFQANVETTGTALDDAYNELAEACPDSGM